mmetsp:Transcript_35916/g.107301  ORF Transcript_35916/g.107301 Transcript_35916/m.107301 type:complete len:82 (-) Transcript_35916:3816-4061(-)
MQVFAPCQISNSQPPEAVAVKEKRMKTSAFTDVKVRQLRCFQVQKVKFHTTMQRDSDQTGTMKTSTSECWTFYQFQAKEAL